MTIPTPSLITFTPCDGEYIVMLDGTPIGTVANVKASWYGYRDGWSVASDKTSRQAVTAARTRRQAAQLLADLHTGAYPLADSRLKT